MCLQYISMKRNIPKTGVGWKLFAKTPNGLKFAYQSLNGKHKVPRGKWLKAKRTWIRGYLSGFHIYMHKPRGFQQGIVPCTPVKVRFRDGRILGTQDNRRVIVVDEMFVPRTRNRSQTNKAR